MASQRRSRVNTVDSVRPDHHRTPVVQALLAFWRWLPDIIVFGGLAAAGLIAYIELTRFRGYGEQQLMLPWWAALCVIIAPLAVLAALPRTRHLATVLWWVNVTRHRMRTYMAENQIRNVSGRLPWLMLIYPTKVGERAWMWLPAGLSIADIEDETDSLGSTCYARSGEVHPVKKYAHIVRIDIHRRDVFESTGKVRSKLIGDKQELELIPASVGTNGQHEPSGWAHDKGLTSAHQSTHESTTPTELSTPKPRAGTKSFSKPTTTVTNEPVVLSSNGEDISDYV